MIEELYDIYSGRFYTYTASNSDPTWRNDGCRYAIIMHPDETDPDGDTWEVWDTHALLPVAPIDRQASTFPTEAMAYACLRSRETPSPDTVAAAHGTLVALLLTDAGITALEEITYGIPYVVAHLPNGWAVRAAVWHMPTNATEGDWKVHMVSPAGDREDIPGHPSNATVVMIVRGAMARPTGPPLGDDPNPAPAMTLLEAARLVLETLRQDDAPFYGNHGPLLRTLTQLRRAVDDVRATYEAAVSEFHRSEAAAGHVP